MKKLTSILFLVVLITLFKAVRLVPQGSKWVVQRLGKFQTSLSPGLNFLIPFVDVVAFKATTKDIVLEIPSQEVITRDNVVIIANAVAYINIISPEKAVYGVEDYELAIRTLVQTSLRSIVGEMSLDDALSSREQIKTNLKISISVIMFAFFLSNLEIQDIQPSGTMQSAMEEQAAAERQRRATVTRADGEKNGKEFVADGGNYAEAKIVLAEATKSALTKVSEAIQDKELPAMYLLGEKYIEAVHSMSKSPNSKLVILPADLPAAVRGIMSNTK